ncbi:hypothetical protein L1987_12601 [Smallanthus sonchifolius]|uniref:Uncharacterized protein n=1 Tax=Smallanthus sonchifolius TaxID=185202 RepID=A0ACB9JE85_9ASTR|nr:hypothetical protein L1987_12601 [Smallanthus sonchifolius]
MNSSSTQHDDLMEPVLSKHRNPPEVPPVTGGVVSELEEILSDTSFNSFRKFQKAITIELYSLFRLGGPAIVVYLLNNVTSMSTQVFCGHLGNLELAVASLGNNGVQHREAEVLGAFAPVMEAVPVVGAEIDPGLGETDC